MAVGLLCCGPTLAFASHGSTLFAVYVGCALFGMARGLYDASLFAAVFDDVADRLRSSVIGLLLAAGFLIGAASPIILGFFKATYGLGNGLTIAGFVTTSVGAILMITTLMYGRGSRSVLDRQPCPR
jgi:hypothetical protein